MLFLPKFSFMKFVFTLLLCAFSVFAFGQKMRYLNQNFVEVNYKEQAAFYTETYPDGPQAGTVKTFTLDGVLVSEEGYSNIKKHVRHGLTRKYYPSGKLKAEMTFNAGALDGPLRTFYPNQRIKRAELFEKGASVQGKCFSKAGYDTTFFAFHANPEFQGGAAALDNYLIKHSRFPLVPVNDTLIRKGFEKFAVVKFTVDTAGKISDVLITRSISDFMIPRTAGAPYDREAVRLVSTMPAWEPAKQDGESIVSEHWITIGFK